MNYRNALTGIALILVFSASQAISAKTTAYPATSTHFQNPSGNGVRDRPDLNLTADQKAQLKSIHQSERDQLKALRNDQTLSREQKAAKARSIREASQQQLLGILTPQQQQTLKNARGERRERGRGPEGGEALNLTADQRTQVKSIHEGAKSQIDAVKNDSTLTAEQKEAKIRSIHQNTMQQVSAILTPEQRAKMRDHRQDRRGGEGRRGGRNGGRPGGIFGPRGGKP